MESYQEKADTLSKRFGISPVEAMKALEECDGDILDAVGQLEAQGIINRASANYSTRIDYSSGSTGYSGQSAGSSFSKSSVNASGSVPSYSTDDSGESGFESFVKFIKELLKKGMNNNFQAERGGKIIIELPVLVLVILLIFGCAVTVPLLIIGLFAGCRYSFKGKELGRQDINNAMNMAADSADRIKKEFRK